MVRLYLFLSTQGLDDLQSHIHSIAAAEKYMGERIPEAWLKFEERMLQ